MGIGIDMGYVTFAEVGGVMKSQFDIIGNCVNGAARIQSLTKEIGKHVLLSKELVLGLGDLPLKGKLIPVGTFAIRGQGRRTVYAIPDKVIEAEG